MEGFLGQRVFKSTLAEDRERWEQASTISHVGSHAPPFFVLHGEDDSIIPVGEGREFVAALSEKSDEVVVYSEIPHAQHAFDFFGSPHGHFTATAVAHFLDWVKAKRG